MDKYSDDQYDIFKEEGILKLRLPGGQVIKYDGRFGMPELSEGEHHIVPNTE